MTPSEAPQRFKACETEPGGVAPGAGLFLERPRKGRGEEWSVLADVLPDRRLDLPTSQGRRRSFG